MFPSESGAKLQKWPPTPRGSNFLLSNKWTAALIYIFTFIYSLYEHSLLVLSPELRCLQPRQQFSSHTEDLLYERKTKVV